MGYPQGFPQTTCHQVHMVFVYIASFWSANRHSVSDQPISIWYLIRPSPPPCGVHKLWNVLCSLHSDSNHQTNNNGCTQPLASSTSISSSTHCINVYLRSPGTCFHCMLHQQFSTQGIHIHFQGMFLHLPDLASQLIPLWTIQGLSSVWTGVLQSGSAASPSSVSSGVQRVWVVWEQNGELASVPLKSSSENLRVCKLW